MERERDLLGVEQKPTACGLDRERQADKHERRYEQRDGKLRAGGGELAQSTGAPRNVSRASEITSRATRPAVLAKKVVKRRIRE